MLEFNIGGRPTRAQYQYTLQDANLDELNQWSSKIIDK
jgi:HAE1 family hydrophobic/amphiphilic exporter-1